MDDDSDPTYRPIDALIERYVEKQLEYAQFQYKGVDYRIMDNGMDDDSWCICFDPTNHPTGIVIREFSSFLDLLDTPILHDGSTVREAFITISGKDTHIN